LQAICSDVHFQISWGTKQDNDEPEIADLGAIVQNKHSQVDVEVFTEPSDVNQMYTEALDNLRTRKEAKKPKTVLTDSEIEQQAKDYYANVRTNVSPVLTQ
jgi:chitin synthase